MGFEVRIYLFASCVDSATGEGQLYKAVENELTSKGYELIFKGIRPTTHVQSFFNNYIRSNLLLLHCIFFKILNSKSQVCFVNFCPIWNPLVAFAAHFGVILGPLTGAVQDFSIIGRYVSPGYTRMYLLPMLARIFRFFLPSDMLYWTATSSGNLYIGAKHKTIFLPAGIVTAGLIGPILSNRLSVDKKFDFLIYSRDHPMKWHSVAKGLALKLSTKGFKGVFIGEVLDSNSNIESYSIVDSSQFNDMLNASRFYINLTFEDGGIAPYQALKLGVPVLFHEHTAFSRTRGSDGLLKCSALASGDIDAIVDILRDSASRILSTQETAFHARVKLDKWISENFPK